jgi:hypothetical protein
MTQMRPARFGLLPCNFAFEAHFADDKFRLAGIGVARLLGLDICSANYLGPFLGVLSIEAREPVGGADEWLCTKVGEPRFKVRIQESGIYRTIDFFDDFSRCIFWRTDALPTGAHITGDKFGYRRNVGQNKRAVNACHSQGAQPSRPDVLYGRNNGIKHHLALARKQIR